MKKLVILAIVILFITTVFPVCAFAAADNVYEISELSMSITLPQGWDVFTRDMQANQPLIDQYGIDETVFEESMLANSIYLDAYNPETGNDIYIAGIQDSAAVGQDYRGNSDSDMDFLVKYLEQAPDTSGADITWIAAGENKFTHLEYGGSQPTLVQYITLSGGISISVYMRNEIDGTVLTAEDIAALDQAVQSIKFSNPYTPQSYDSLYGLPTDFSFDGMIDWLNSMYTYSLTPMIIPACVGIPVAVLLIVLYFKKKNGSPLALSPRQARNLYGIRGPLVIFAVKNILYLCSYALGIFGGIMLYFMGVTSSMPLLVISAALTALYLIQTVMFFKKTPAYYLFYIIASIAVSISCFVISSPVDYISNMLLVGILVFVGIEAILMVYWVLSKRVAVTFRTRKVIELEPTEETAGQQ